MRRVNPTRSNPRIAASSPPTSGLRQRRHRRALQGEGSLQHHDRSREALILAEAGNVGAIQTPVPPTPIRFLFFVVARDYVILGDDVRCRSPLHQQQDTLGQLREKTWQAAICLAIMVIGALVTTAGSDAFKTLMSKCEVKSMF